MRIWLLRILSGVMLGSVVTPTMGAISVTANDWMHSLTDNIRNAGEYYDSTISTSTNVTISGTADNLQGWTLAVRLSSTVSGLNIATRRTGNGGFTTLSGGDVGHMTLTTAFQNLFTGSGNANNIPLEFLISNFDVNDGHGDKRIDIEYQVTATP